MVVFLVSNLSQPRAIRRIESIAEMGYDVIVYGYDRCQYNCNKFSPSIPIEMLGQMSKGGDYFGKAKQIRHDIKRIVHRHGKNNCMYYSFGIIESFFLLLAGATYAYEISDIAYSEHRFRSVIRFLDRILIKNSVVTVMTSPGFKTFLNVNSSNIIFQPNKVNRKLRNCERHVLNKNNNQFVFSFVGSIRYVSVLRFAGVIGKSFPQHEFHFYGVPNLPSTKKYVDDLVSHYPNIKYFGEYKNPEDLERIYNSVDVIVTTYGMTLNETLLDANKLYEGILFCRPLVATDNTFMAEQIARYQCGFTIDSSSEESICNFVLSLTKERLNAVSVKERSISDEFPFDDTSELKEMLIGKFCV